MLHRSMTKEFQQVGPHKCAQQNVSKSIIFQGVAPQNGSLCSLKIIHTYQHLNFYTIMHRICIKYHCMEPNVLVSTDQLPSSGDTASFVSICQVSSSACSNFTCICAWSLCKDTCATSSRSCAKRPCRCSIVPEPAWPWPVLKHLGRKHNGCKGC